jgi:hypothetical protein
MTKVCGTAISAHSGAVRSRDDSVALHDGGVNYVVNAKVSASGRYRRLAGMACKSAGTACMLGGMACTAGIALHHGRAQVEIDR